MKKSVMLVLMVLVLIAVLLNAEEKPVAISPGHGSGMAMIGECCPTFSWTSVSWATAYKVSVFEYPTFDGILTYQEIRAMASPVIDLEIKGSAYSWTPASEQALRNGTGYVWFVQAIDMGGTGIWSAGKQFKVNTIMKFDRVMEKVRSALKEAGVGDGVLRDLFKSLKIHNQKGVLNEETQDTPTTVALGVPLTLGSEGDASDSVYYGNGAGNSLTSTSYRNAFFGKNSGYDTTGHDNTFVGAFSGYENTSGNYNTFLGYYAGRYNTTGPDNTYIGSFAGYNSTGYKNVFIGASAGYNEAGSNKMYIENSSSSSPLIYGEFDNDIVVINGKLGVGTYGYIPAHPIDVDGYVRTKYFMQRSVAPQMRWYETDASDSSDFFKMNYHAGALEFIWYDASSSTTYFPIKMEGNGYVGINNTNPSHMLDVGTSGAYCNGVAWVPGSSIEYKENIRKLSVEDARKTLECLEPVRFNYKQDKEEEFLGFIAEEVPELVATNDRKGVVPMDVVSVLTRVVQDQQKTINEQKEIIYKQVQTNHKQNELLNNQNIIINDLENRMKKLEQKK